MTEEQNAETTIDEAGTSAPAQDAPVDAKPKPQAPRVTEEHVNSVIGQVGFHRFEGTTTTVCIILLKNGFTLIGKSACVSPENFDEEKGREIAYNDAREQIWALEGYLMRERIHHIQSLNSIGGVKQPNAEQADKTAEASGAESEEEGTASQAEGAAPAETEEPVH